MLQSCCKATDTACIAFLEPEEPLLEPGQSTQWPNTSSLHLQCYKPSLWSHMRDEGTAVPDWGKIQITVIKEHPQTCQTNKNYKRKEKNQNNEPIAVLLLLQESILVTIIHVPEWKTENFKSHKKLFSLSLDNQTTVLKQLIQCLYLLINFFALFSHLSFRFQRNKEFPFSIKEVKSFRSVCLQYTNWNAKILICKNILLEYQ